MKLAQVSVFVTVVLAHTEFENLHVYPGALTKIHAFRFKPNAVQDKVKNYEAYSHYEEVERY